MRRVDHGRGAEVPAGRPGRPCGGDEDPDPGVPRGDGHAEGPGPVVGGRGGRGEEGDGDHGDGQDALHRIGGCGGHPTGSYPAKFPYANTTALYDVTGGSNGGRATGCFRTARTGYDGPTGPGTPKGPGASAG
ncbi:hypothetical protein ACWD0Z_20815 [Streptomyces sp. NPDC003007]